MASPVNGYRVLTSVPSINLHHCGPFRGHCFLNNNEKLHFCTHGASQLLPAPHLCLHFKLVPPYNRVQDIHLCFYFPSPSFWQLHRPLLPKHQENLLPLIITDWWRPTTISCFSSPNSWPRPAHDRFNCLPMLCPCQHHYTSLLPNLSRGLYLSVAFSPHTEPKAVLTMKNAVPSQLKNDRGSPSLL